MSVRALQARIDCDHETLEHLWRTHLAFNSRLPKLLRILFKMRRGEVGDSDNERALYQLIGRFITGWNSKDADYLLNSISAKSWKPDTAKARYKVKLANGDDEIRETAATEWADAAVELLKKGKRVYDKQELLGDLPGCMSQMVCREVVSIISSHEELVKLWEKEHEEWLAQKAAWEADTEHRKYLALRPKFEDFERDAGGKATKRRGRWHKYLEWMRANQELAAWRGGQPVVNAISPLAEARIRRAKPWKKRTVEAEEFWKVNPELAALDRLHGYYERQFVRRRKTKKHPDGFKHRPTFTLPQPVSHPRWFVFNAPQTKPSGYGKLSLPTKPEAYGTVELILVTSDVHGTKGKLPTRKVSLRFRGDPRLSDIKSAEVETVFKGGTKKGEIKMAHRYSFFDRQLRQERTASIGGAKLIFKDVRLNDDGSLKSAVPYLYFAVTIDDIPVTARARDLKWEDSTEITTSGRRRKQMKVPDGLVACAVDLVLGEVGFATLAIYEAGQVKVMRSRNLWTHLTELHGKHQGRLSSGPRLDHIARHKRDLRRRRRLRGKPVKGEESHVELQSHIDNMAEDRFKKGARAILNFALNAERAVDAGRGEPFPRADIIIIEQLGGLIPDAERERGINRALASWNRRQLVDRLKQMAEDAGFKRRVYEISPWGTSQVCSRCGAVGRRYAVRRDPESGMPDICFGFVERLFACPSCGYRANADHNASVNLHRRFLLGPAAVQAFDTLSNTNQETKDRTIAAIEQSVLHSLRAMHQLILADEGTDTPF